MTKKRFSALVAGAALAASVVLAPQAAAEENNTEAPIEATGFGERGGNWDNKRPDRGDKDRWDKDKGHDEGSSLDECDDKGHHHKKDDCGAGIPVGGGSGLGLGLSALAGSALLSSGASALPDDQAPAPVEQAAPEQEAAPVEDAKAVAQAEAEAAPVEDHKAIAQAQAEHAAPAPVAEKGAPVHAAPAPVQHAAPAHAAPAPVAQPQQLANTGVEGTLVALATGLLAAAAGAALLVLRRRAA